MTGWVSPPADAGRARMARRSPAGLRAWAAGLCLMVGAMAAHPASARTHEPTLADTVFQHVEQGHDEPDAALQALAAMGPGMAPPTSDLAALRHWALFGQGLVLAGAGRSTDTWTVASHLRQQTASTGAAATAANALGQADAQLVQAVLADTQGQSVQAVQAGQAALDGYGAACAPLPQPTGCDYRKPWRALLLLARHAAMQGQASSARDHALAAAELAHAAGDTGLQAWALAQAADISASLGENDIAQRQFAQARRLSRLQGSAMVRTRLAIYETRLHARAGDFAGARRAAQAGLELAQQAGSPRLQAVLLANLSDALLKSGRPREALAAVEQALPTVRRHGELRVERVLMVNAGLARIGLGQREAAGQALDELLAAFEAAGAHADRATVLREFADALAADGDLPGALALYHRERALAVELTATNRRAAMAELQQRYDRGAQQQRLDQLAHDNRLIDTQLANRQTLQRLWALGAVVLLLAGVLLALMYRRVREINRQLASSHARLQVQSQCDPLTGLANRRCLHERAASAADVRGALLLLDIDHFKRINDQQGHASGDTVLVEVARRLAAAVRPEDLVVRWGGEEFLIYAPLLDAAATRALAQRVLRAVSDGPVQLGATDPPPPAAAAAPDTAGAEPGADSAAGSGTVAVTASVGFACFPQATGDLGLPMDRAINLVDMALYTAKNQGRHRAVGIQQMHVADDAALRVIEADFDSAWRAGRMVLDLLPGPPGSPGTPDTPAGTQTPPLDARPAPHSAPA